MTDTTYNGWSNYPTWAVNLWLSNDGGLYHQTLNNVEYIRELGREGVNEQAALAEQLEEWVKEMAHEGREGASYAADLLGYALDQVDWREIAAAWLEDTA